jgi:thymidylate synthase ThyX
MHPVEIAPEQFTPAEEAILQRYFTNTDQPVFALKNLPEVVKGALFARYSRSPKSLRRLFLDEFFSGNAAEAIADAPADDEIGRNRAEALYDRVFGDYGDDSVAQLGGAHIACELASNLLTKVLERGRLAAYLEQSTRYIVYDVKWNGTYRYRMPSEVAGDPGSRQAYVRCMDRLFDVYAEIIRVLTPLLGQMYPCAATDAPAVWRSTLRAKACDTARGLLPASTLSNVGIFATGQAYEAMLLRMFAHPLEEVRDYAAMMLRELRKVIPSFLKRVDQVERGVAWTGYFRGVAEQMAAAAEAVPLTTASVPEVVLCDFDPDGEDKIIAAALYEYSGASDEETRRAVAAMSESEKDAVFAAYCGNRRNRRHKPGRAMERCAYRFDILADYGTFRDLQRHRMLTVEWQKISSRYGYTTPDLIEQLPECSAAWHSAMAQARETHELLAERVGPCVAQYVVPFAYKMRFSMQMNAREAFHMLELRTQRQGHADYRRICQTMHALIRNEAGHRRIAEAMTFIDGGTYDLERLEAERHIERKRALGPKGLTLAAE